MTPSTAPPVIFAKNIRVGFDQNVLLHDINLTIGSGEVIAVIGQNGCGKTTLLKTLLGIYQPLAGELTVCGLESYKNRGFIGYMPQQLLQSALLRLSSRTLLTAAIQARQWGLPWLSKNQSEQIDELLAQVGAEKFADAVFNNCSGGEQRRISLALALLGQPKILLLDEPLANLDFHHQEKFIELLFKLARQDNVTILMTTHDLGPVTSKLVSRIIYIANGRAVLGNIDDVLTSEKLTELYNVPMTVINQNRHYFVMHGGLNSAEDDSSESI
jgi:zinc/manganese transport system ATP-binding protein